MNELAPALSLLLALAIGLAAGWFGARWLRRDEKRLQALEEELETSRQRVLEKTRELENYRGQVNQHFQKTAELFHGLTEQYREVYLHLAHSAQQLVGEQPPALRADIRTAEQLARPQEATENAAVDASTEVPNATKATPGADAEAQATGKDGGDDVVGDAPHVPTLRRETPAREAGEAEEKEALRSPAP